MVQVKNCLSPVGGRLTAMVALTPLEGKIKCCIKLLSQPSFLMMPSFGIHCFSLFLSQISFKKDKEAQIILLMFTDEMEV